MITFDAVTKRYPDGTVAVDALSLEIPAGQTMVLVGPSGCGKTTSLRMINRLIEPTEGTILIDGQDVLTSWASPAPMVISCPIEIRRIRSAFSCEAVSSAYGAGMIG